MSVTVNGPEQLQKLLALAAGLPVQDLGGQEPDLGRAVPAFLRRGAK